MATADKQRRLLRMALKMARAPSPQGPAPPSRRLSARRRGANPAEIRAAVSQATRHARGHAAGILNAACFTALYNKPVSRGPWAWGVRAPPRLLQGRRPRDGACVGAAGGGATTTGLSARGRGASRRRRASCEGDARGGACVCAAGGNAATAGLSARGRGPIAGAARVAGLAWARLVEAPPLRAPRPVGGGRWGAAAPLAGEARAGLVGLGRFVV